MKTKNIVILGVTALSLGAGLAATTETANAATYTPRSWRGTYYMNTDSGRSYMKVNTYSVVLNGKTMYKNTWNGWRKLSFKRISSADAVTKKHKLYTFNSLAKYGYQSSRQWRLTTKNGKKELINYQVQGYIDVWHKVSTSTAKYKSFHGYRIEIAKYGLNYNTWYDKETHATLSDYRPTQKSKVIFQYGSHVYPTQHEWSWIHGDYVTDYKYSNGAWHKTDNIYVPD